jgi:hypothetical protein
MSLLRSRRAPLGCGWTGLGTTATLRPYLTWVVLLSHITSGFILPWDPELHRIVCTVCSIIVGSRCLPESSVRPVSDGGLRPLSDMCVGCSAEGLWPTRRGIAELWCILEYVVQSTHSSGKSVRFNVGVFGKCSDSRRNISRILS